MPEEIEEETEEIEEIEESDSLVSPIGLLMLLVAFILDVAGVIMLFLYLFFGIGIAGSFVLDIIGIVVIGVWMFLRSRRIKVTRRAGKIIEKGARKILARLGLAFLAELIPVVGDVGFCWTYLVYDELKKS